jgi:hypothetical protein
MSSLQYILDTISVNMDRVAKLGQWPEHHDVEKALLGRIPRRGRTAPGFDAGVACALGMIPRPRQELACKLHANYDEDSVETVRHELAYGDEEFAYTDTCWWLAACSVCKEGNVDLMTFRCQLDGFQKLMSDPEARVAAARKCYRETMASTFVVMPDGVVFTSVDGGAQGAYLAGHDIVVSWAQNYGIFFLSTFRPSLGLEEFAWSDAVDAKGQAMSGSVRGSRQFVKCATFDEVMRALAIARAHLG